MLRRAAGVPIGLPATKLMASIGAFFMQTETELILKSRRVVPGRLRDRGFEFKYPDWPDAAAICATDGMPRPLSWGQASKFSEIEAGNT